MLGNLLSALGRAIITAFSWLWRQVKAGFLWLWALIWNNLLDLFWAIYAKVISWIAGAVSYLFPSNTLDFDAQTSLIVQNIAGWDRILPIHEMFSALSILVLYHLIKLLVKYGTFAITMVRKFIPF